MHPPAPISPGQPRSVARMFARIARRYDLLNALITFGLVSDWRRRAVRAAGPLRAGQVLDVGTGTGALAFALADTMPAVRVVGVDFTAPMLALAVQQAAKRGWRDRARFALADALRLPFADRTFDCTMSAFVLRNVADAEQAFREQARVLRAGGRVVCVELTRMDAPVVRHAFDLYFHQWVPILGAVVTGDAAAYRYLPASVARFPSPEALAGVMHAAGLVEVRYERMGFGTVALHVGRRP